MFDEVGDVALLLGWQENSSIVPFEPRRRVLWTNIGKYNSCFMLKMVNLSTRH